MTSTQLGRVVLLIAGFTVAGAAEAADTRYPDRPIRLVVPFAPAGAADIFGRIAGEKLSAYLGQQVVIDNRGGGGGAIGAEIVANAKPDGYTLLLANTGPNAIDLALRPRKTYDPLRDLAPVSQISLVPMILDITGNASANSISELIATAKASPGRMTYASAGVGSIAHLTTELFKAKLGIDIAHVPYKGTAPALTDLMSGQVSMMFTTTASSLPHIRSGRLKVLAIADNARSSLLPDTPTMAEAGVKDFIVSTWYGIVAPAKTPEAIIARLHAGITRGLKSPDVMQRFDTLGAIAVGSDPKTFGAFMRREVVRWTDAVKISGARPE